MARGPNASLSTSSRSSRKVKVKLPRFHSTVSEMKRRKYFVIWIREDPKMPGTFPWVVSETPLVVFASLADQLLLLLILSLGIRNGSKDGQPGLHAGGVLQSNRRSVLDTHASPRQDFRGTKERDTGLHWDVGIRQKRNFRYSSSPKNEAPLHGFWTQVSHACMATS